MHIEELVCWIRIPEYNCVGRYVDITGPETFFLLHFLLRNEASLASLTNNTSSIGNLVVLVI
jgi:hypothetical protein